MHKVILEPDSEHKNVKKYKERCVNPECPDKQTTLWVYAVGAYKPCCKYCKKPLLGEAMVKWLYDRRLYHNG